MIKKRHYKIKLLILILLLIAFYYLITQVPLFKQYLSNPESLKNLIISFGFLAPLAIILLQFLQTTISIVPSQLTTILAGFIFGPILGLLYSLIGAFLGSMFIFSLARKYGKKPALKFFEKKDLVHFNHFFKQKGLWALFMARIAPLFPNDMVSFGAGLTNLKFWNFNLVSTAGFIVQIIILTYFGAELSTGQVSLPLILISTITTLIFLIAVFEKQIKHILIKDMHKIEKTIEKDFQKL